MKKSDICSIVPVLNEEKTIGNLVRKLRVFSKVIVIDDCSSDNSFKKSQMSGVQVLKNPINYGYDKSLVLGFRKGKDLKSKYLISFDGDGQHSLKDFKKVIKYLTFGYSVVSGKRNSFQRISEKLFSIYTSFFHGIIDPLTGLKGYNLKFCQDLGIFDFNHNIGTKVLLNCSRKKKKFIEINIKIKKRKFKQASRFGSLFSSNVKIFFALFKTIFQDLTFFIIKK